LKKNIRIQEPVSTDTGSRFFFITKLFTSVRTTITLLFLLAVCAIVGTVIPQGELVQAHGASGPSFANRLVLILDLNNVYRSWWFTSLLVLLATNIMGCLLKRAPLIIEEWKGTTKKSSFSLTFTDHRSVDSLRSILTESVRGVLRCNPETTDSENASVLKWERHRIYLLGFPLIHIAIIIILIGGLIGVFFGFRGHVQIKVNETSSSYALLSTGEIRNLPFTIAVDGFTLTRYPTGEPKEFRSDVRLLNNGKEELKGSILVNHPLTFQGISLYQSDYRVVGISRITLSVANEKGETETFSINPMEPFSLKDYPVEIKIRGFDPGSTQRGAGIELVVMEKDQKPVTLRLYENDAHPVKAGPVKLSFRGHEPTYATGLQVGYDPGSRVVWIGSIMLIVGFIFTLFTNLQRLQMQLVRDRNETRITVSGRSKRMRKEFRESIESAVKTALEQPR
jgi:cytochrome c biogenesis protein